MTDTEKDPSDVTSSARYSPGANPKDGYQHIEAPVIVDAPSNNKSKEGTKVMSDDYKKPDAPKVEAKKDAAVAGGEKFDSHGDPIDTTDVLYRVARDEVETKVEGDAVYDGFGNQVTPTGSYVKGKDGTTSREWEWARVGKDGKVIEE